MEQQQFTQLNIDFDAIRAFCELYPIQQLALFGSILRDDFTDASDIDVLVTYLPDATITLFDMASQEIELSKMIVRSVDLRTAQELSPHFRQEVLDSAQVIYGRP